MNISLHASQNEWIDAARFEQEYPFKRRIFFRWIEEGKLEAYKPSRRKTLVKRSAIDRFLESSKVVNSLDAIVDETLHELSDAR
jgi:excisionase family DNA binding protein